MKGKVMGLSSRITNRNSVGYFLLITTFWLVGTSRANPNVTSPVATGCGDGGFNFSSIWPPHPNQTRVRSNNTVLVGGSQRWRFGFNYSDWALKNAPFYLNDVLVFKYDPPRNGSHPHSVFLLPDFWSYLTCDLRRGMRVANPSQGVGDGFKFVLKRWRPHYFACGESNGFHCSNGTMKFFVMPTFRY
ncbi:hypothetical protein Ancab_027494 [Ancistrocladus abbreviatus]